MKRVIKNNKSTYMLSLYNRSKCFINRYSSKKVSKLITRRIYLLEVPLKSSNILLEFTPIIILFTGIFAILLVIVFNWLIR